MTDSTLSPQFFDSDIDKHNYIINQALMNVRTVFEAEIVSSQDKGGASYYTIRPLLNFVNPAGEPLECATIPDVPASIENFGNFAVLGKYINGAKVLVGVADRDHSNIKYDWKVNTPQGFDYHTLAGAIIIKGLQKVDETFDNYIDVRTKGELKIVTTAKVNIETKEANVKADQVTVDSSNVKLGKGIFQKVLTALNKLTLLPTSTVSFNGAEGVITGFIQIDPASSGSESVQAGVEGV